MSGASFKHYYEVLADQALTDNEPVDTFITRIAMDNVAHLVDSAPCYRINWLDPTGVRTLQYFYSDVAQAQYMTIAMEFPTTLLRDGRYVGFDVRLAAAVSGGVSAFATIAITTPDVGYPISDPTAPGIVGFYTAVFSNSTPAWVIEGTITGEDTSVSVATTTMICTNTGEFAPGATASSGIGHLRCVVSLLGFWENNDPEEAARLYGLQVREYPVE